MDPIPLGNWSCAAPGFGEQLIDRRRRSWTGTSSGPTRPGHAVGRRRETDRR